MTLPRLLRRASPEANPPAVPNPATTGSEAADALAAVGDGLALKQRLAGLTAAARSTAGGGGDLPTRPVLILIDLDGFSAVNERFGREFGDQVLRETARRLAAAAPPGAAVFRVVADQFAVILQSSTSDEAVAVARQLFAAAHQPLDPGGMALVVGSSTAVVVMRDRRRADGMLRDADVAMYAAKTAGGGHIYLYSPELDDWAVSRKQQVDSLAAEVQYLRQQNRLLSESMLVDLATGLPNAAVFEADHAQLDARRRRAGDPYAMMIADVDWFYDYGERFGEAAAEHSLALVAHTIAGAVRQGDRAYRFGSDEFAVLMPGATGREAVTVAEQIRLAVQSRAIDHPPNPWGVLTVTVGVAEGGFRHATTRDVISEVTGLLQAGKADGRNRIVWPH